MTDKVQSKKLLFGVIFFLLFSVTIADATVFRIPKDTYQDFNGEWRVFDSQNISQYPLYTVSENPSTYTITRQGETFELKKSEAEYDFSYNTITPYSKNLNGKKPFILSYDENIFKTNNGKLKSEKFTWNPEVEVSDDSETEDAKKEKIKGSINNGKITYDIPDWANSVRENTITVTNATTSGWTANVTLTNSTRDLSSGNVTSGFFWDTFDDNIISSAYTLTGGSTKTESNGLFNLSGASAVASFDIPFSDNFNASVEMKTVRNGSTIGLVPILVYLLSSANMNNNTQFYARTDNKSFNYVAYKGPSNSVTSTNPVTDRYQWNTYKIQTSGDTTNAFINESLTLSHTHANITAVKSVPGVGGGLATGNGALVIGHFDNLRYWQNDTSTIDIWQQNASAGNAVNRTRIVAYNLDSNLTIDLYSKANSSASWTLVQANAANNTWYDITNTTRSSSQDFRIILNGNSSDAPIFSELEWDENSNPVFSNYSISESEIYQTSQANIISVDVTDSDNTISTVYAEITYNGNAVKSNYTMLQSGNTYIFGFRMGTAGSYAVTGFHATDNNNNTNSTSVYLPFTVVSSSGSGSGGGLLPTLDISKGSQGIPVGENDTEPAKELNIRAVEYQYEKVSREQKIIIAVIILSIFAIMLSGDRKL